MSLMQCQNLLSLTAISVLTLNNSSGLAATLSLFGENNHNKDEYTLDRTVTADNSLAITKQARPHSLLQQLNLTNEQRQKIKQIHYRYKRQIRKKRSHVKVLQQQLSDMIVGTATVEGIRVKNQQLVDLRQEIGALRFETMLSTREILTPQQRQKFRELVESQLTQQLEKQPN